MPVAPAAVGRSLEEIVSRFGGALVGNPATHVSQVATLEGAGPGNIAFLANSRYRPLLETTRAGAVIVGPQDAASIRGAGIVAADPYVYFARVAQLLNPAVLPGPGVHPSAVVAAPIPPTASIGALAYVGPGSKLGEGVVIGPGCLVGENVDIGDGSVLCAGAKVYGGCRIGAGVIIHSGAVIGADGFGFAREKDGSWVKIPQIGRVVIGNSVEIGANTTIDRGALDDTIIEDGVILDNQIQIAHNVRIGSRTAIAGCVGIAGSTRIGRRCMIGGAASIIGHLTICDDVVVSAGTFVAKSITRPGTYTSTVPAQEHGHWLRNFAHLRRLDDLAEKVRQLEKRLGEMEKDS